MSNSFKNLNNLEGCKQNLRIMLDFYFEIIQNKKGKSVSSRMEYDGGVWLQVFFTKCCSFLTLLDGIEYSKDNVCLKKVVDFPTLFTIARSLYESLVAFEILYVIPDTEEKKTILYNLFMAQGLSERLKDLNEDVQMRYSQRVEEEKKDIRDCLEEIKETNLYKSLPIEAKHIIDNMFEKKYRYIFQEDNSLKSISFEDAYKYLNFDEKSFYGSYSFFSLHGHPSYLTLIQFRDAFVGEERADLLMAKTAAHYVLSFMSIFILDFMKIDEEMKGIFDSLEKSKREFICFFEKLFRNKNK